MNWLNEVWATISPYFAGVTISGVVSAIIYACLKSGFSKTVNKLNVEEISNTAVTKGVEKIKTVTLSQDISPLVKSELVKVTETVKNELLVNQEEMKEQYNQLITIVGKLASYFDTSIAIPDEKKAEMKELIIKATLPPKTFQSKITEEIVKDTVKEPTMANNAVVDDTATKTAIVR